MTADADHEQETTAGSCDDATAVVPADASSLTADAAEYAHAWSVETDEFQPLRQRASAPVWAILGLLVVVVAVAVV